MQAAPRAGSAGARRGREHRPSPDPKSIAIKIIAVKTIPDIGTDRALRRFLGNPSLKGLVSMISGAYLRRQAEILIAMSRATFDLTVAGRLRRMAAELQAKAAEEDDARKTTLCPYRRAAALPAAGAEVPASADRLYLLQPGPGNHRTGSAARFFKACPSSAFAP